MRLPRSPKPKTGGFESRPFRSLKPNENAPSDTSLTLTDSEVSVQVSHHHQLGFSMAPDIKYHPYIEARLIVPSKTSKDQGWIIKYYVWSAVTQKQEMFRKSYDLNTITDHKKRHQRAEYLIKQINQALRSGKIYDPEKALQQQAEQSIRQGNVINVYVAIDAFLQAQKRTNRNRTYDTYLSHLKIFKEWLQQQKLSSAPLTAISTEIIEQFLNQILADGKSPRTFNNYHNSISALFNFYHRKRRSPIIRENPCIYIQKLKTGNSKHIAFTQGQQAQLIQYCLQNQYSYWLATHFIYYLLARTNEISLMKIGDIDIKNRKIYLHSEDSKNWEERWITIPNQLHKIIIEENLLQHPSSWYIFSKDGLQPGPFKMDVRRFGSYYRQRVLNKLKFKKGYTFYSWKHTGVIATYRAGIPPADIRRQTGHRSWVSFEKYLYSLGLFENTTVLRNYPTLAG